MIKSEKHRHAEFISASKASLKKTLKQVQGDVVVRSMLAYSLLISRMGRHAEFISVSNMSHRKATKYTEASKQGDVLNWEVSL